MNFRGATVALLIAAAIWAAPEDTAFRFVILGDRTGEAQPGVYERVWKEAASQNPALVLTVGDTIQGLNDATAEAEWREAEKIVEPYRRFPLYLAPGNHDIWSELSEKLYVKHSRHPVHYSFDAGPAHFTILDNSRSDQFSADEMSFLEKDLKANADRPVKFIVSHRPSWIFSALLGNTGFPLQQLAKQYGVCCVIAGHVHEMLHFTLDGVEYISMPSSGGHLRASGKYEDGWFFGYAAGAIRKNKAIFEIHELNGRTTTLADWGATGLKK